MNESHEPGGAAKPPTDPNTAQTTKVDEKDLEATVRGENTSGGRSSQGDAGR